MNLEIREDVLLRFNNHQATLAEEFKFRIEECDTEITIPKGFTFDGSSHPRAFNSILGGRYKPKLVIPSLIHDYLLEETDIDRKYVHRKYYEELKRNKVRGAFFLYVAVVTYDFFITKFYK